MHTYRKNIKEGTDLDIEQQLEREYLTKYPNEATIPDLSNFVLPRQDKNAGYKLVNINVDKFDRLYKNDMNFYVGPKGTGAAIHGRYDRFKLWLRQGLPIEASSVYISEDLTSAGFSNGRHRYAVLRDMGMKVIPVSMDKESIKRAIKLGIVDKNPFKESYNFKQYYEESTRKIVSFDFDNTLADTKRTEDGGYAEDERGNLIILGANEEIVNILRDYHNKGYKVIIVTARPAKSSWQVDKFIKRYNLPVERVYYTHWKPKKYLLSKIPIEIHYDDTEKEIMGLKEVGINTAFVKGGRVWQS